MGAVILIARLLLAAAFAAAGIAKLADEQGSKKSLLDLGAPASWADSIGLLLPVAELACAVALLWTEYVLWGAEGAAVLLALFTMAIAIALARGKAPNCHCFGQWGSKPVSRGTLRRHAALLVLAIAVIWKHGGAPVAWPSSLAGGFKLLLLAISAVLGAALAATVWMLLLMRKQNARLLQRLDAVERELGIDPNAAPAHQPHNVHNSVR